VGIAQATTGARGRTLARVDRSALADAVRAWALSRVLCYVAGIAAVAAFGAHPGPHDPLGLTSPFGSLGNKLVAPGARWDSVWYLLIADHGYVSARATEFFPLYPLTARAAGAPLGSSLIGGLVVSLASLLAALYLLRKLVETELGTRAARRTMLLVAFFPTAVFFSAVYTEALFLALSIGAFYAARRGHWAWAGIAGGLASLTRPTGVLLLVPLALLYLYGPRDDRPPAAGAGFRPRYRLAPNALWLLAVPAGLGCFMVYLAARFGNPLEMLGQGAAWGQTFTFPVVTVWHAASLAASGLASAAHGHAPQNVYEFGAFCLACVGTVGAFRRLPVAYGAYAAAGILFIASFPFSGQSLASFSRYMTPLFPIVVWWALWASERRIYKALLVAFALLMLVNSARFATWHWVA